MNIFCLALLPRCSSFYVAIVFFPQFIEVANQSLERPEKDYTRNIVSFGTLHYEMLFMN